MKCSVWKEGRKGRRKEERRRKRIKNERRKRWGTKVKYKNIQVHTRRERWELWQTGEFMAPYKK